jgi:hypothetical protein
MRDNRTFQIHANVNASHGDSALRVTISWYDENGDLTSSQTWRRHVTPLWVEGSDWTAFSSLSDLAKMLADACGTKVGLDDIDVPLF